MFFNIFFSFAFLDLDAEVEGMDELPAPLLPSEIGKSSENVDFQPEGHIGTEANLTLEDYLSTSDNMSLLSLDVSSNQFESDQGPESLSMYRYVKIFYVKSISVNFKTSDWKFGKRK